LLSFLERLKPSAADRYPGAKLGHLQREHSAETTATARYDDDLVLQEIGAERGISPVL
jgi:hypothetical protein